MDESIVKNLKIIEINVNSIIKTSRRYDLLNFIKLHNPDIVLLNETKLNTKHKLHFEEYELIRNDRLNSTRGGGVAILIKRHIKFKNYTNKTSNLLKCLEACIIKIPLLTNKTLYIISAYYPSGNNSNFLISDLNSIFKSLNLQNSDIYYILSGDLNCKHSDWGNVINNTKGSYLREWLENNEISFKCSLYASTIPSYPRCGSYLDLCLADSRLPILRSNNTVNSIKTLDYDSDHRALQIDLLNDTNDNFSFFVECPKSKFNYRKTNWIKFRKNINNACRNTDPIPDNRNLSNSEIDYYLKKLNDVIIDSIDKSVPQFKDNDTVNKFVNPIIKKLQAEKSKTLTKIKKHNRAEIICTPQEINICKVRLKLIKKLINDNFSLSVNKYYKDKLTNLNRGNPSQMFSEVKKQFRPNLALDIDMLKISQEDENLLGYVGINPLQVEKHNGKFIIREQEDILDLIGASLEKTHSYKEIDLNNVLHVEIDNCFKRFLETKSEYESNRSSYTIFNEDKKANRIGESQSDDFFITEEKILYIFRNLRNKLSSGVDTIPNIILKNIPEGLILNYCTLFNNMLNNSYFPRAWKLAKVVVLPKGNKDTSNPNNLRAISLLPNISKIFEICVNTNIIKFCGKNNLTNDNQFGFKYKHSTIHGIHQLVSNINWNLNKSLCTGACLVDFEKAFDNIWIEGLIYKLLKYKFPIQLIILIHNMLNNKSFIVCNKKERSRKKFIIVNGLQQGTVNSPILFNIFIFELLQSIRNIIGFADDIIVYHADDKIDKINENLQNYFNIIEKYAVDWQMKINVDKCETILFRPPVGKCNYNIKRNWKSFGVKSSNNVSIPNKQTVKYLGINLDKFLYFNDHISLQILKARKAFFMYKRLFFSKHIKPEVKLLLYQSLIRPILTYGCQIWFNVSPSYMEKLRKFERKCLRACTALCRSSNSNYTKYISNQKLYNASKISRIDNFIIHLIRNHIKKSSECYENNLIMAPYYVNDDFIILTLQNGYVPPEAFVYLDKEGFIQDETGIPIFFHIYRRANIKAVTSNQLTTANKRFDTSFFREDRNILPNLDISKYWWLN